MMLVVGDVPEGHIFLVQNKDVVLGSKGTTQFIKLSRHSPNYHHGTNVLNCATWMPAYVADSVEVTQVIKLSNLIPKVLLALAGTNWTLLHQQKLGLLSFLDAIQDAVVADEIATESEVFGQPSG